MCHHQRLLEGGKFKLHISFPLTDVYMAAGFDAFAAYKAQALKQQLENAKREKESENRRNTQKQIEHEIMQSKTHTEIKKAEDRLIVEKSEFDAEKNAAETLLEEYRQKVAMFKVREKSVEKKTEFTIVFCVFYA